MDGVAVSELPLDIIRRRYPSSKMVPWFRRKFRSFQMNFTGSGGFYCREVL